MRKHLIAIPMLILASFSSSLFALDADMITFIHSKTKSTMMDVCKKKMAGYSDATCACLGDKAAANIDDSQLRLCSDHSRHCLEHVVETATMAALSNDSIQSCTSTTGNSASGQPAVNNPPLSPNPQPK